MDARGLLALSRPEGPFFFSVGLGWEEDGEGILGLLEEVLWTGCSGAGYMQTFLAVWTLPD